MNSSTQSSVDFFQTVLEVTLGEFVKQMFYELQWGRIESREGFIFRDGRGGSRLAKLHDSDLQKVGVKAK